MTPKNHVFLMYCGLSPDGQEHRRWTPQEVEPLVIYDQGTRDSFFPSFLLLGMKSGGGGALIPGFGTPAGKADWLAWLDDLFHPGCNILALAEVVKAHKLPPVDIWVALPYPESSLHNFGPIWDRRLNFSRNKDRTTALRWWLNRFLDRWHNRIKTTGLERYVTLQGFYWARESMTPKDRLFLPKFLKHIRSLGYRNMWIPYFAVTPFLYLTNPGFDITVIQPSYMQNPALGWQRLQVAMERAKKYGAGIEIEFDYGVLEPGSPSFNTALDYLNRGLPEFEGYMCSRFIAYYTGYKTVVELHRCNNPLYSHLYRFVKGELQKINYGGITY